MTDKRPESSNNPSTPTDELPAIEFSSPGRFTIHNPDEGSPDTALVEPTPFIIGSHPELERFEQPGLARSHALALMQQAKLEVCLYSPDGEAWLYNHSALRDACQQFLLASPKARFRWLLADSQRLVRQGHLLLQLCRKFTSQTDIRLLNPQYPTSGDAYLLIDQTAYLRRPEPDSYSGYVWYHAPAKGKQRFGQFEQAWNTSQFDPNLRSMPL
ncbi:DUF7931 domain-containing protein [Atopomonas sediminilitoris]|uniref:DUF7931 domain-containing protein n=1 Tax=Atopomonas sediminilitoris TaxID=2919919 RepID=UPI001F4EBD5F|nr:histone acetyltransferase HPA2 [Atopomonas sediminilitoris]MCJ8170817.1 histone acetyltransferase HPA2 [Atopomonas sediminilitoris]